MSAIHPRQRRGGVYWFVALFACLSSAWAQHPVELNNAGVEAFKAGDYAQAVSLLERAYREAQDSPVVRRNLCNAYQSLANGLALSGDFRSAIRYVEAALGVDPENASPFIQVGSYYLRQDDLNTAIQRLEEAIRLKPGDLDAHELLGQAYYMDNDLSSARAQWDYVLEMAPDRPGLQEKYDKAFREESVEFDFNKWKSRHFRISYPPDVPNALRVGVSSMLDRAYIDIGRKFSGVFPPPPIHVILYKAEQFAEATQLEGHVGAVYDGKIRSPLTDASNAWLKEDDLQRRLSHEYVHVVVRFMAGDNVPWWLNEGLAETMSRTLTDQDVQRLRALYAEGAAFSLSELDDNKMNQLNPTALRLAYLQAHATVDMLWNRYGRHKMMTFLQMLKNGMRYEEAFQATYRRTYAILERDVAGAYR